MKHNAPDYALRRLTGMIIIAILAAAAGFSWGEWYGYEQGKRRFRKG